MTPKRAALALLGVLSFACPLVEMLVTGRVDPFSAFGIAETFLSLLPIYWWYHTDKQERNYRAGPLMNVGVIALAIVALPIYFVRSRGWKGGAVTSLVALVVFGITLALGEAGEWLGDVFR